MNRSAAALALIFLLGNAAGVLEGRSYIHHKELKLITTDWAQLNKYAKADGRVPSGKIVFFGDSITEFWDLSSNADYINRGAKSQKTSDMVSRFRQDVLNLQPKTVVILGGTNDVLGAISQATIENNIKTMVELSKLHGIRPILCSVLPIGHHTIYTTKDPTREINTINAWLRSYATQEKVEFVDYFSPMAGPDESMKPGLSKDGVHPTEAGYAVMRATLEEKLRNRGKM